MKKALVACWMVLVPALLFGRPKSPIIYSIPLPPKPDFSSIQWLVGEWSGKTGGAKAAGEVHISVVYALDQRFLRLEGDVALPATKTAPATHESWVGMLARGAAGTFALRLFTSNGFMARYRVTVAGNQVFLNPEGGALPPPGWLFRWTFAQAGPDACTETVEVAPPGKSFFNYYSAKLSRNAAAKPAVAEPKTGAPSM